MTQIVYQKGAPLSFTATKDFGLGNFDVKVLRGSELEFDGSVVVYDGNEYSFPQLRSAVTSGWLVLTADYVEGAATPRVAANIKVRSATETNGQRSTTVSTSLEADERIVMSSTQHASATKASNTASRTASFAGSQDEGVPVRTLKTAARSRVELTASSAGAALAQTNNVQIDPGRGLTEDDMLSRMTEEEQEAYLAKKQSRRDAILAANPAAQAPTKRQVGKVKTAAAKEAGGITASVTTGGGIEAWDGGDAPVVRTINKQSSSASEVEGVRFQNTNIPPDHKMRKPAAAPAVEPASADLRRTIAKAVCPDFPDAYDFTLPERKKLARLRADFEERHDILRAVYAAESDSVKSALVAEFPEAFGA